MRAGKNPNSKWKIVTNGIVRNNPTFRLVLGTCPTLALTTAAMNGIYGACDDLRPCVQQRDDFAS